MLIAFEGINGVGKTACLGVFNKLLEQDGKECEVITSKPTTEELKAEGLYETFTVPKVLSEKEQLDLARIFFKKQSAYANREDILVADRWFTSTVVYTLYHDLLKEENEKEYEEVMEYYNNLTADVGDMDISLMMTVKGKYRDKISKLVSLLMMTTGKRVVVPDVVIYVSCDENLTLIETRGESKIISRYEQEDIDKLLRALYSIVNDLLVDMGYCGRVINYENKLDSDFEETIKVDMESIYLDIFRNEQEDEDSTEELQESQEDFEQDQENENEHIPSGDEEEVVEMPEINIPLDQTQEAGEVTEIVEAPVVKEESSENAENSDNPEEKESLDNGNDSIQKNHHPQKVYNYKPSYGHAHGKNNRK